MKRLIPLLLLLLSTTVHAQEKANPSKQRDPRPDERTAPNTLVAQYDYKVGLDEKQRLTVLGTTTIWLGESYSKGRDSEFRARVIVFAPNDARRRGPPASSGTPTRSSRRTGWSPNTQST
jgi:hypothetical protein